MIRLVRVLEPELMRDCHYIVNTFMDVGSVRAWFCAKKFLVDSGRSIMFVDEKDNGYLRGFIIGDIDVTVATVDELFVDRKFHRMGVGTALLQVYENYACAVGVQKIKLQSRPTRQALGFYQKHGYQKINWENYMQKTL